MVKSQYDVISKRFLRIIHFANVNRALGRLGSLFYGLPFYSLKSFSLKIFVYSEIFLNFAVD